MTQDLLHATEVRAARKEVGRRCVPQAVRRDVVDPCERRQVVDRLTDLALPPTLPAVADEKRPL